MMNDPVKMREHFTAMQDMMRAYVTPGAPYVDRDGISSDDTLDGLKAPYRSWLFAQDMIHMLDGPEQRAAFPNEPTMQERVNAVTADGLPHPDGGATRPDARR